MRIVTWNCAGGFCSRNTVSGSPKWEKIISRYNPDILLIQECESAEKLQAEMKSACKDWFGFSHEVEGRQGSRARIVGNATFVLGKDITVELARDFVIADAKYISPLVVSQNGKSVFNLLNVWTNTAYCKNWEWEQFEPFAKSRKTVAMGDFDWPSEVSGKLFKTMSGFGLLSAYHCKNNKEEIGKETNKTNRARSRAKKEYFLDYCFIPEDWMSKIEIEVGLVKDWIDTRFSDHTPVILDIHGV